MASPIRPFVCQTVTDMYRLIKMQNTDKDGQELMLGSICTCEGNPRASKRRIEDDVEVWKNGWVSDLHLFYVPAQENIGIAVAYTAMEPDMDTSQERTFDVRWRLEALGVKFK